MRRGASRVRHVPIGHVCPAGSRTNSHSVVLPGIDELNVNRYRNPSAEAGAISESKSELIGPGVLNRGLPRGSSSGQVRC